jgi:hypothetical protein
MVWFSVLKTILTLSSSIFNKFKLQKDVEQDNRIKELEFKFKQGDLEKRALEKADEKIDNFKSYLNKS